MGGLDYWSGALEHWSVVMLAYIYSPRLKINVKC